ncbi:MAG: hypothetical protein Q7T05_02070 [Dehalococcoidia bacterium]|nr:hypothetical protein [Dehalococcoidia bacterium]
MNNNATNNDLTRYQILMDRRFQIEKVFWSRVQTLHVIQAAVLASGFFLLVEKHYRFLSGIMLLFGAILTFFLGLLAHNDWKDAAANDIDSERLCKELNIKRTAGRHGITKFLNSHRIMFILIGMFLAIDIILAIALLGDTLLATLLSRS